MSAAELVDVVDARDRVLRTATRDEVRGGKLRHRATYVLVLNGRGQLFVHRRTAGKDVYPSYWDVAVGGVVGAGEDYGAAARRELEEEIGACDVALEPIGELRYEDESNRVNGAVFSCRYDGPLRLQAEEIESGEWLEIAAVAERARVAPFCPDGLVALDRYLERRRAAAPPPVAPR